MNISETPSQSALGYLSQSLEQSAGSDCETDCETMDTSVWETRTFTLTTPHTLTSQTLMTMGLTPTHTHQHTQRTLSASLCPLAHRKQLGPHLCIPSQTRTNDALTPPFLFKLLLIIIAYSNIHSLRHNIQPNVVLMPDTNQAYNPPPSSSSSSKCHKHKSRHTQSRLQCV